MLHHLMEKYHGKVRRVVSEAFTYEFGSKRHLARDMISTYFSAYKTFAHFPTDVLKDLIIRVTTVPYTLLYCTSIQTYCPTARQNTKTHIREKHVRG